MAGRAEIGLTGGSDAVLAEPVAVVDEMALGRLVFGGKIHVATVTVAERPLVPVLVAAEACRHLRTQGLGPRVPRRGVATDAVAVNEGCVFAMGEAKVRARELGALAHVRLSVAAAARPLIVRSGVTATAVALRRQVQRPGVVRALHPDVALDTRDSLAHVRAMLEGVRGIGLSESEHACAGGEQERRDHHKGEPYLHGSSSPREMRASAFVSNWCVGVDAASAAAATSQPRERHASAMSPHGQAIP